MNFKAFIETVFEGRGSGIHAGRKKRRSVPELIEDPAFLQKILDEGGVSVDDDLFPYFGDESIGVDADFYTPDEFSRKFAGGGGIKMRTDLDTGDSFLSAGIRIRLSKDSRRRREVLQAVESSRISYKEKEKPEDISDLVSKFPTDKELEFLQKEEGEVSEYHTGDIIRIELDAPTPSEEGKEIQPGSYKCKVVDVVGTDLGIKIIDGEFAGEEISLLPDVMVTEKLSEEE